MRAKYFKVAIIALVILSLLVGLSLAQPPGKRGGPQQEMRERFLDRIPDITEKQNEHIKDFRTNHMKEVLPLRNQIEEKKAHLKTLSTSEKVDMATVNKTIEEIGQLKMEMAKKRAAHRQKIRNILSEDQRIFFDSRPMKKEMHQGFDGEHSIHRMPSGNKF